MNTSREEGMTMNIKDIEYALHVFTDKWKPIILYYALREEQMRYRDFQRVMPHITNRMLTLKLRTLVDDGLLTKIESKDKRKKVMYSTTTEGESLAPILRFMNQWGEVHLPPDQVSFPHEDNPGHVCSALTTIETINGKWKPYIIVEMLKGTKRFTQLLQQYPSMSKRTLSNHLGRLEEDGLIERIVYDEIPPRVDYSITEYGETLRPLLKQLEDWGRTYYKHQT